MRSMTFIAFILLTASAAVGSILVQHHDAALQPILANALMPADQDVAACASCHAGTMAAPPPDAFYLPELQAECTHCHSTAALQRRWQGLGESPRL